MKTISKNLFSKNISFNKISKRKKIYLYAGDIPSPVEYSDFVGLSIKCSNINHILHDVSNPFPLPNNCVDIFQSEDVFEHIELEKIIYIVNEIYRILKSDGLFRLSLPDYRCDILHNRSKKDEFGGIIFDPEGGGDYFKGKVINGGHLWFPVYEKVKEILIKSLFSKNNINFLHYYDEAGYGITNQIDYSKGYISRTPDHDDRIKKPYRPMSIVVDCTK